MMTYLKIERSDTDGFYIIPASDAPGTLEAELDGIDPEFDEGIVISFSVYAITDEAYAKLPEFTGW